MTGEVISSLFIYLLARQMMIDNVTDNNAFKTLLLGETFRSVPTTELGELKW